jgi:hypothetical protein
MKPKIETVEKGSEKQIFAFPGLVYKEFLAALVAILILSVWSVLLDAPLKEVADPNWTENPAKAPWYFVGLQEVLVYFDPWIAGVSIPVLIIIGLMLLPYMDPNPDEIGVYGFRKRRFIISIFLFGYLLWFLLIVVGQFFRGPSWQFYWPWEDWAVHKPAEESLVNLSNPVGGGVLIAYFGLGFAVFSIAGRNLYRQMGRIKFVVAWTLALFMFGILGKIILRVFFHVKYIINTSIISI